MKFLFEDAPPPAARARPIGLYVGVAVVLLLVAGAAGWFVFARPGALTVTEPVSAVAVPAQATPMSPSDPAAASSADSAVVRSEPVEEFLEPTPVASAPVASATSEVTAPASPEPAFTPVTVPRVPDAAPLPVPPARPSRSDDAPWAPEARVPQSPADTLARLRGALAQCAAMSNELSRASCLARTRQNFCGDAWGRIPECPTGN